MQEQNAAFCSAHFDRTRKMWLGFVVVTLIGCAALTASAADGQFVAHSTPGYVATAKNVGTEDPTKTIEVSIWLNMHNRGEMDELARQLYDPTSSSFRHFLKRPEIAERFAPTADEAKTVQRFFEAHNLKVVAVGPDNFFVRARGTVGDVETAFHVQLNNYQVRDQVVRANSSDAYVEGAAGPLVRAVSGLDSGEYTHPLALRSASLPEGKAGPTTLAKAATAADAGFFQSVCFPGTKTETYSTGGSVPIATYKGNHYFSGGPGCGYSPANIYGAYNLNGLYKAGYNGAGQTIVIIDWCFTPTIKQDTNAFSARFGLPLLTSSNFQIIQVPTVSSCEGPDVETNLDVEWAHAIAPGAKIDLLAPTTASFQDVDEGEFYAVNYQLGNAISGSFGSPESLTPASVIETENLISEIAAMSGISVNYATGDDGDYSAFGIAATATAPADSPWATALGGVSVALNSENTIEWQAGWGMNESLLIDTGTIFNPPLGFGFVYGSGGGASNCAIQDSGGDCLAGFPKPAFQKGLPGNYRQLPDISWVGDPLTGVVVLISEPGQFPEQVWLPVGGTSAVAPMFSGLWAIANQEAGAPLGQAAQYVYSLPAGAITDVVPVSTATNVTAVIQETTGTNHYNPNEVMGGAAPGKFISALFDDPLAEDTTYVLSFGTDCSTLPSTDGDGNSCNSPAALHTKVGWDNVTGVGTPNGQVFADSFKPATAAAVK
jgi:subtilase family serine protease